MRGLLRLLREHPDAVEADLSRFHRIDIRDRTRFDECGRRCLTLAMIWHRLKWLPPDAAWRQAIGGHGFTATDYLLMDLFQAWSGQAHPADDRKTQKVDKNSPAMQAARRRAAQRRADIAAGLIT